MIGIDTNVLVRYLAQDDEAQSAAASRIIDGLSTELLGYISQVVLVETVWVFVRSYKVPRAALVEVIEMLLRTRELVIEGADVGYLALATFRSSNADFSDALIAHGGRLAGYRKR